MKTKIQNNLMNECISISTHNNLTYLVLLIKYYSKQKEYAKKKTSATIW